MYENVKCLMLEAGFLLSPSVVYRVSGISETQICHHPLLSILLCHIDIMLWEEHLKSRDQKESINKQKTSRPIEVKSAEMCKLIY